MNKICNIIPQVIVGSLIEMMEHSQLGYNSQNFFLQISKYFQGQIFSRRAETNMSAELMC